MLFLFKSTPENKKRKHSEHFCRSKEPGGPERATVTYCNVFNCWSMIWNFLTLTKHCIENLCSASLEVEMLWKHCTWKPAITFESHSVWFSSSKRVHFMSPILALSCLDHTSSKISRFFMFGIPYESRDISFFTFESFRSPRSWLFHI